MASSFRGRPRNGADWICGGTTIRHKSPNDSPPRKAAETKRPFQTDKRGTTEQPLTVNLIPTPEQKTDAGEEKANAERKAVDDRKLVEYTGYLVFVGVVQFGVFVLQLIAFTAQALYMRRTVSEMQSTTSAAIRAACAAEETIGHMRETAQRQLRAYVYPVSVTLSDFAIGSIPTAEIAIKNTGQTPAYKLRFIEAMVFGRVPPGILPDLTIPPDPPQMTLGAGMHMHVKHGEARTLADDERTAIMNGTGALYAFGKIEYFDVFKQARFTDFRFMFGRDNAIRGDFSMSVCHDGNDSD
jgi:hypothetical protein